MPVEPEEPEEADEPEDPEVDPKPLEPLQGITWSSIFEIPSKTTPPEPVLEKAGK